MTAQRSRCRICGFEALKNALQIKLRQLTIATPFERGVLGAQGAATCGSSGLSAG